MPYSADLASTLLRDANEMHNQLNQALLSLVRASSEPLPPMSAEHLRQGAGRRIGIIRHCIKTIFKKFPPSRQKPLDRSDLYDVQIAHHAFVINLYGLFENLAWAFILRHNLQAELGDRRKVGLFLKATQRLLPDAIKNHLTNPEMINWHENYLKNYRDALAHRVPLYIPPSTLTNKDIEELTTIGHDEQAAIIEQNWDALDDLRDRKLSVGHACLFFAHSYNDSGDSRPIYLHPQIICDVKTAVDFVPIFLGAWHERA